MSTPVEHHALEFLPGEDALALEDGLWWVQGRKAIIRQYMGELCKGVGSRQILDVGCGSGGSFDVLREFRQVWGFEPSATLAARARRRSLAEEVYEADLAEASSKQHYDIFTLFDVLEHIEDDRSFLKTLSHNGPTEHHCLISVPAHPFLFGQHDRLLHHHRRYTKSMLRKALAAAGYEVRHISHHMTLLFPAVLLARLKDKLLATFGKECESVDIGNFNPALSAVLRRILEAEARTVPWLSWPFGLWLFCVASRTRS
jgi:SAM-dependent methyltransferase